MDADERKRINQVVERHEGNMELTARALALAPDELTKLLRSDPYLAARWLAERGLENPGDRPALDIATEWVDDYVTGDPPSMPGVSKETHDMAQAIVGQDKKLREFDWKALGFTDGQTDRLRTLEGFVGCKIVSTLQLAQGGVVNQLAWVQLRFDHIMKTLMAEEDDPTSEKAQILHNQMVDLAGILLKTNSDVHKSAHLLTLIEKGAREVVGKAAKRKPGWNQPQKVEGTDSNVVVDFEKSGTE